MDPSRDRDGASELSPPAERFEVFHDRGAEAGATRWEIDLGFLSSEWRCLWGQGCVGILASPAPELGQGCCSVGAELLDADEARRVGALGATLDPGRFQFAAEAAEHGVFAPGARRATRIVDGACIFLNRPGFSGGEGCALHVAALAEGESPVEWKPSICWQLPLKIDVSADGTRRLRRWRRRDWWPNPEDDDVDVGVDVGVDVDVDVGVAWCCTEDRGVADAYAGDGSGERVIDGMADELEALLGPELAREVRVTLGPTRRATG